jgi:hypothetical protein
VQQEGSKEAQPPVSAPRLYRGDVSTQRIEKGDNRNPDQIDASESDTITLGEKTIRSQKLLCLETLGHTE